MGFKYVCLKWLLSDLGSKQLTCGLLLGAFLGFVPDAMLLDVLICLIVLIFRFNFLAFLVAILFFSLLQWLSISYLHMIGEYCLLHLTFIKWLSSHLYQIPFFAYFNFDYTTTMGAYCVLFVAVVPLYYMFLFISKRVSNKMIATFSDDDVLRSVLPSLEMEEDEE